MKVPEAVVAVLATPVEVGVATQAFPFFTVDDAGSPHCAVLSSTEVGVADDGEELFVVLGGRRSRAYLEARGRATLLAVEGTTLHTVKLALAASLEHGGVFTAALGVEDHQGDSLGIELTPLGFVPPPDIAERERWDVTAAALAAIRNLRS